MELSLENIVRAAFPRTSSAVSAKFPRQALAGIMDAASLPGRAYASIADKGSYLDALGRTSAAPGQGRADTISEEILRDPTSILGIGAGGLAKAASKKLAATASGKIAPWLIPYAADAVANAGTNAAAQYGTAGAVDPTQIAIGTGLGLGMQWVGAGAMKMAKAKAAINAAPGDQQRAALNQIANDPVLLEEFTDRIMDVAENHNGSIGIRGQSIPVSVGHKYPPSRRWIDGAPTEEILNGSSSIGIAGDWASLNYKRSKEAIKSALEKSAMYGDDFHIVAGDFGRGGEDAGEIVIPKAKSIFSLSDFMDKNRGAFSPVDPNIAPLTGSGARTPSLQLPGFAKRLGSRYMNDTTATSGRR